MDQRLFKLVFNNIVIFNTIFAHVRLYKKNEEIIFKNRKELLEYKEREYISKLVYESTEMLVKYDLPVDGVLKKVEFTESELSYAQGDVIPHGVEILIFASLYPYKKRTTTPFSTLPPTIHTIKQANVINSTNGYDIPPNITSISFIKCPNISGNNDNGNGFITIPNTIKELKFILDWENEGIQLRRGDIPDSVTKLSILSYPMHNLSEGILPNSIKDLKVSYTEGVFDYIPLSVESLFISYSSNNIKPESNLNKCTSIKKLIISSNGYNVCKPNSLPPSITDLSMLNIMGKIEENTIPNNVTSLKIQYMVIYFEENAIKKGSIPNSVTSLTLKYTVVEELPSSLTSLDIFGYGDSLDDFVNLVSILPPSLTSFTLPEKYKDLPDILLPSTIENINYDY